MASTMKLYARGGWPAGVGILACLTFLPNAAIIFGGRNGSDLGSGSPGGNGGTINITVRDLFNSTNIRFIGIGGYSTKASTQGGNGGNLTLNFHGLIRNLTATTSTYKPVLTGGSSVNGTYGYNGYIIYNKDMSCPRDADVNGDGRIAIGDIVAIGNKYNNVTGETGFNENYDIDDNCDGIINIKDMVKVGFEWDTR